MWLEIFLMGVTLFLIYKCCLKPSHYPPGTFGIPILGHLPPAKKKMVDHIREMRQQYGDIFTTKWGSYPIVFLTDHNLIKKAFSNTDIQGRLDFISLKLFNHMDHGGILTTEGQLWHDNRRFMLRNLRDLGMGKTSLEGSIHDEAESLVKYLEKMDLDNPVELDWSINVSVLNVIWQMLASKRFEPDDEEMVRFTDLANDDLMIMQGPLFMFDVMPWLRYIVPDFLFKKITRAGDLLSHRLEFKETAKKTIEEHEKTLDPDNPRDVIDSYLLEMKAEDTNPEMDYTNLLVTMTDMFVAGSETSSNGLRWLVLCMTLYPEVQKKVHDLLDANVPKDRLPSLEDRPTLQYLEACILETLRFASITPIGVAHTTTKDVAFEGFTLPKRTIILAALEIIQHDPKLWERPTEFYPEHFLKEDGTLDTRKEQFMPFSSGRRQCLGESLARMELYLFASAILQRFTITAPEGEQLDTEIDPKRFLLNQPKPFKVILKKRV